MSTTILRTLGTQFSSHRALFSGLRTLLGVCLLSIFFLQTASGDDLSPPPWRGGPLSTVAEWDFLTANAGPPDGTSIVPVIGDSGGVPLAIPGPGIAWDPFDGTGAWIGQTGGGTMRFELPNWIDTEPIKFIQIQMTFQPNPSLPFPGVTQMSAFDPLGVAIAQTNVQEFPIPGSTNGMWQRIEEWRIWPNPDSEFFQITILPDIALSQVVVDTISVPEPSSAILAALGLVVLAAWGWRRKR
jgi:hypothetical protein